MTDDQMLGEDFGRAFITVLHETLSGAAPALGDLDRRAGDGDFGDNVRVAMKNAEKNIAETRPATYREWVGAMSMAWLGVGGTSGPLNGMFFRELSKAAAGQGAGDGVGEGIRQEADGAVPTLAEFTEGLAAGQATVQRYGQAKVGDKTMIDALAPAVEALREGGTATEALARAAEAARTAAQGTAEVAAKRGRASYVGDVSKGVMDPGAAAMALVIASASAAAAGESTVETDWIG